MAEGGYQLSVALYHRDHLSTGKNRQLLQCEAYHWALHLVPVHTLSQDSTIRNDGTPEEGDPTLEETLIYDATDASEINPITWRMNNPTMDWYFRAQPLPPDRASKLLGCVGFAHISDERQKEELERVLREEVPLPGKDTHPQESCVTWVVHAVRALMKRGLAREGIDVEDLKGRVLRHGDDVYEGRDVRRTIEY